MKTLNALAVAAALAASAPLAAYAQDDPTVGPDDGLDPAKVTAFDKRGFAGPLGDKASACFVRRYDATHLRQHPKQKVGAMKLLVTAEKTPGEPTSYAYHIGVQFRNKPGNFDGGSSCGHLLSADGHDEITFTCDADCGGGGLEIAMPKDNKSAIVRLEAIAVWDRKHPDGETISLQGGTDDKVFRVDRVDNKECAELLTKRDEVAELKPQQ
jgi:hypothetical protein